MKHKLLGLYFFLVLLLLLGLFNIIPVQAGDPDDTIGPTDPTMLVCVERGSHLLVDLDSDAFDPDYNPEIEVDVERLKRDCEEAEDRYVDADFTVEYLRQSRIEGHVFEFHPDPHGPGGWTAVRSRDVPVVASGPGFEVIWGSEKDGFYYFDYLGAGPVTLNLRLPPDAHPINSNITVVTRAFFETWEADLGFYRGDIPPEDIDSLRLPPDHQNSTLLPSDTIIELDEESGLITYMPNVGGVLPQNQSISILALAAVILVLLPAAGFLKFRRKRVED